MSSHSLSMVITSKKKTLQELEVAFGFVLLVTGILKSAKAMGGCMQASENIALVRFGGRGQNLWV